jgi:hypothetical protein
MRLIVLILTSCIAAAAFGAEPQDRYLTVVRRAADALLAAGVDDFGPQKSALILSVLDPKSGRPLGKLPKAPSGVRASDRCPPYGSNANLQQDLYRTLDDLSRITGDARYAQASLAALVDYSRHVTAVAAGAPRTCRGPDADGADQCALPMTPARIHLCSQIYNRSRASALGLAG